MYTGSRTHLARLRVWHLDQYAVLRPTLLELRFFCVFQKWKYLFSFYNVIVWVLVATTLTFLLSPKRCLTAWRSGWIAVFLAWINFIMYLRRYNQIFDSKLIFGSLDADKLRRHNLNTVRYFHISKRTLQLRCTSWAGSMKKGNIKEWAGHSMSSLLRIADDTGRWAVIAADVVLSQRRPVMKR